MPPEDAENWLAFGYVGVWSHIQVMLHRAHLATLENRTWKAGLWQLVTDADNDQVLEGADSRRNEIRASEAKVAKMETDFENWAKSPRVPRVYERIRTDFTRTQGLLASLQRDHSVAALKANQDWVKTKYANTPDWWKPPSGVDLKWTVPTILWEGTAKGDAVTAAMANLVAAIIAGIHTIAVVTSGYKIAIEEAAKAVEAAALAARDANAAATTAQSARAGAATSMWTEHDESLLQAATAFISSKNPVKKDPDSTSVATTAPSSFDSGRIWAGVTPAV